MGAPACGDVMKLQIMVNDETGEIEDVRFKTFGCGSAIASSSLATEKIKGLKVWDAKKIKNTEIAKELSLPPVKLHCSSTYSISQKRAEYCTNIFPCLISAGGGCYQISSKGLGGKKGGSGFEAISCVDFLYRFSDSMDISHESVDFAGNYINGLLARRKHFSILQLSFSV